MRTRWTCSARRRRRHRADCRRSARRQPCNAPVRVARTSARIGPAPSRGGGVYPARGDARRSSVGARTGSARAARQRRRAGTSAELGDAAASRGVGAASARTAIRIAPPSRRTDRSARSISPAKRFARKPDRRTARMNSCFGQQPADDGDPRAREGARPCSCNRRKMERRSANSRAGSARLQQSAERHRRSTPRLIARVSGDERIRGMAATVEARDRTRRQTRGPVAHRSRAASNLDLKAVDAVTLRCQACATSLPCRLDRVSATATTSERKEMRTHADANQLELAVLNLAINAAMRCRAAASSACA